MRRRGVLALLVVLSGCAGATRAPVPADLFAVCLPVPVPLPPAKPRTPDSLAAWGNGDELALREANRRIADCDARRAQAVRLLDAGQ